MGSVPGLGINLNNEKGSTTIDDDVPTWDESDSWRYGIGNIFFQLNQSGQFMTLDMSIDELLVDVLGSTDTSYQLSISGDIGGIFDYDDGAGTTLGGILFITKISGDLQINKSDLACKQANIVIRSIALLLEHPFMFPIPIPLPLTLTIDVLQDTPRPLIDFPLFDGKQGILPETSISTSIRVESIVLRILSSILPDIPEEIYIEQNVSLPMLMYTATEEQVPVHAGNYTAYKIEFFEGIFGSLYYAPAAGNYIKAVAEINTEEIIVEIKGELKETTYS
jgi:hypothetical protein